MTCWADLTYKFKAESPFFRADKVIGQTRRDSFQINSTGFTLKANAGLFKLLGQVLRYFSNFVFSSNHYINKHKKLTRSYSRYKLNIFDNSMEPLNIMSNLRDSQHKKIGNLPLLCVGMLANSRVFLIGFVAAI